MHLSLSLDHSNSNLLLASLISLLSSLFPLSSSLLSLSLSRSLNYSLPLQGAHTLLLLSADARAALRYVLQQSLSSTSAAAHALFMLRSLPPSLSLSAAVASPGLAAWCRALGLILALLIAPLVFANCALPGELSLLAASVVLAGITFEIGMAPLAVVFVALALFFTLHLLASQIPFNDTGEEMLYVSIASALGSFGLFYALSYSSSDIFLSTSSLYVFLLWGPLSTYLAVYVACLLMVRPNTYFVASAYGAWLITAALIPFLLSRKNLLEPIIRLLLIRGHFSPIISSVAVALFWNHGAALLANSV